MFVANLANIYPLFISEILCVLDFYIDYLANGGWLNKLIILLIGGCTPLVVLLIPNS